MRSDLQYCRRGGRIRRGGWARARAQRNGRGLRIIHARASIILNEFEFIDVRKNWRVCCSPPAAACAACKYQRRRCGAGCPLARYFPHHRPRVFRNAHRLFGVSNILKTLDRAGPDPDRRHEAMQCVVYESQAWDLYPSAGCVPIIVGLQNRIQQAEHELRRVHADLQAYRRAAAFAQQQGGGRPPVHRPDNFDGAGACHSAGATSSSSSPPAPPPPFQLQWSAAMGDDEGIAAAAARGNAAVTSNDGNMVSPQYAHPFFVNATTMVPQFHYGQQQPIVVSTHQLPELQEDDMMNYFADGGNDEMPRASSTDSWGEKAMRNAPKMKDNNGFIKQDIDSSSALPAAANKS